VASGAKSATHFACVAGAGLAYAFSMLMRALFAASLLAGLLASLTAVAQAPPPVPALPDTQRITSYNITASTCVCAVGFQIYGDQTDVDSWVKVMFNGGLVLSTDPTFGWSLSSPTGPLSSIPRPITDAVFTFNSAHTGTVSIIGAERPRRLSTFPENAGVTARSLNQVINTVFAELREGWDRTGSAAIPFNSIQVPVRSSAAATVTVSPTTDYFLCLDPTANAITVNLPASPLTGATFLVKDCTGTASSHNITLVPASGNIDNASTFVINAALQSIAVTYNGVQWSVN
jgi:hypothetical protein